MKKLTEENTVNYLNNFSKAILAVESNDSEAIAECNSQLNQIGETLWFCHDCKKWVEMAWDAPVCAECDSPWLTT
jgi:rubrerythrin